MPVTVRIPTRVTCDAMAVRERPAWLIDAFETAASRAVANSRERVLDRRGAYVGVSVRAPEFSWTGDGVAAVDEDVRTAIEERLRSAVAGVVRDAGLFDHELRAAAAPLRAEAAEPPDEERMHWLLGTYAIPSYDDGGAEVAVDVAGVEHAVPPPDTTLSPVLEWATLDHVRFKTDPAFRRAVINSGQFGEITSGTMEGVVFRHGDGWGAIYWPRGKTGPMNEFAFTAPTKSVPRLEGTRLAWTKEPLPIPVGQVRMKHVTVEDARRAKQELLAKRLREAVKGHRLMSAAEKTRFEQKIDDVATKLAAESYQQGPIIRAEVGATVFYMRVSDDARYKFDGELVLRPVYTAVAPTSDTAGKRGTASKRRSGGHRDGGNSGGGDESGGDGDTGLGSFVFTGSDGGRRNGGAMFPAEPGAAGALGCVPLLGEPRLSDLGSAGKEIAALIRLIAFQLQIEPCDYAARFAVNAAVTIGSRAGGVATRASSANGGAFTAQIDRSGNLGAVHFAPTASPAIQFMRHLAQVVPAISSLSRSVQALYAAHADQVEGTWGGKPTAWSLHFLEELSPRLKDSVGFLFGMTCQVVLLQLLRSSRKAIDERLANIAQYAKNFEQVIVPQLAKIDELEGLLEELKDYARVNDVANALDTARPLSLSPASTWIEAARLVANAMKEAAESPSGKRGQRGQITIGKDGQPRVWDAKGRLWARQGIERAIVQRRGFLEQLDPLIKQFVELDEVMDRFENGANGVRIELESLLREMAQNNADKTKDAESSWMFAFRASKIRKDLPSATVPNTTFALQGIHLRAHEQIGEFFRGDGYYAEGIKSLFHAELGRESLMSFFEFTGILLLSVVCPPAGMAVGAGAAVFHYAEALDREQLYESLLDPELVLTRAEVEAELFAAKLGVAFSFIPEAGSILGKGAAATARLGTKGATRAAAKSTRQFVKGGASGAARLVAGRLTKATAEALKRGLVKAFAEEIVTDQVMELAISRLFIEPKMQEIMRETRIHGPIGGTAGAQQSLNMLSAEAAKARGGKKPGGTN